MNPQERDREILKRGVIKSIQTRTKSGVGNWNARPSGGGSKKEWHWAKLDHPASIESTTDPRYGKYSHREMEWDEDLKRLKVKEDGIVGSYEDETGYARELMWGSPYCMRGHIVKMYKQKDYYVFEYNPTPIFGRLNSNNIITAGAPNPSFPSGQTLGSGNVTFFFYEYDVSDGGTPSPPFSENKYSGRAHQIKVFNNTSSSIPPFTPSVSEPMWVRCSWEWGRWMVSLPVECIV
ncbi:hypothetical protein [Lacunimicrobium album]